jgi:hypothetical protein
MRTMPMTIARNPSEAGLIIVGFPTGKGAERCEGDRWAGCTGALSAASRRRATALSHKKTRFEKNEKTPHHPVSNVRL